MEKIETGIKKEKIKMPEIEFRRESGLLWFYVLKSIRQGAACNTSNEKWGKLVSEKISNFILKELNGSVVTLFDEIDEETVFWIALSIGDKKRMELVTAAMTKHKETDDPGRVIEAYSGLIEKIKKNVGFLEESIEPFIKEDLQYRQKHLPKLKESIFQAVNFLGRKSTTKVNYSPC